MPPAKIAWAFVHLVRIQTQRGTHGAAYKCKMAMIKTIHAGESLFAGTVIGALKLRTQLAKYGMRPWDASIVSI